MIKLSTKCTRKHDEITGGGELIRLHSAVEHQGNLRRGRGWHRFIYHVQHHIRNVHWITNIVVHSSTSSVCGVVCQSAWLWDEQTRCACLRSRGRFKLVSTMHCGWGLSAPKRPLEWRCCRLVLRLEEPSTQELLQSCPFLVQAHIISGVYKSSAAALCLGIFCLRCFTVSTLLSVYRERRKRKTSQKNDSQETQAADVIYIK